MKLPPANTLVGLAYALQTVGLIMTALLFLNLFLALPDGTSSNTTISLASLLGFAVILIIASGFQAWCLVQEKHVMPLVKSKGNKRGFVVLYQVVVMILGWSDFGSERAVNEVMVVVVNPLV